MKYLFVDIDHTVSNARWRENLADHARSAGDPETQQARWKAYHLEAGKDEAWDTVVERIAYTVSTCQGPIRIAFVTGRYESCRAITLDWIHRQGLWICHARGFPPLLYMRADRDARPNEVVKADLIQGALSQALSGGNWIAHDAVAYIDDDPICLSHVHTLATRDWGLPDLPCYLATQGFLTLFRGASDPLRVYPPGERPKEASTRAGERPTRQEEGREGVPEALRRMATLYEERGRVYGTNYKQFGPVAMALEAMAPEGGWKVETRHNWNRMAVWLHILNKITRYAVNFNRGGHADSLDDISVYAQMLRELDERGPGE